jgi:hypothetical protein
MVIGITLLILPELLLGIYKNNACSPFVAMAVSYL